MQAYAMYVQRQDQHNGFGGDLHSLLFFAEILVIRVLTDFRDCRGDASF